MPCDQARRPSRRCSSRRSPASRARWRSRACATRSRASRGARDRRRAQLVLGRPLDVHEQVHPIEQRPAQPPPVAPQVGLAAPAAVADPGEPARARVRRRDEHEPRREHQRALAADDRHAAVLERLAQRLERSGAETPRARRETARRGWRASPRRAAAASRRPPAPPARSCGAAPGTAAREIRPSACSPATLWIRVTSTRLGAGHRRQDRRQPPREHRLAGSRRPLEQQVVAAGRRDLERQHRRGVAAHVGQVGLVGRVAAADRARRAAAAAARPSRPRRRRAGSTPRRSRARRRAPPPAPRSRGTISRCRPGAARALRRPPARPASRAARRSATARRRPRRQRSASAGTWPLAASTPSASAASNPGPTLRRNAGARLAVIRVCGNSKPEFRIAARTRSRDSRTAVSPSPTIVNAGQARTDVDLDPHLARIDPVDRERRQASEHRPDATRHASDVGHGACQFCASRARAGLQQIVTLRHPRVTRSARSVAAVSSDPRHRLGALGEQLAAEHLVRRGFRDPRAQLPHALGRARHRRVRRPDARVLRGQDTHAHGAPGADARSTRRRRASARRSARWPAAG